MIHYVFFKPCAIPILGLLAENLNDEINKESNPTRRRCLELVQEGARTLMYNVIPSSPEILQVMMGLNLSEDLYKIIYPGEDKQELKKYLVGKPYGILVVESGADNTWWREVKGKFWSTEYPEGTGLRKSLRRIYAECIEKFLKPEGVSLPKEDNFVHMPDNEGQAENLYKYLRERGKEEGVVLFERQSGVSTPESKG